MEARLIIPIGCNVSLSIDLKKMNRKRESRSSTIVYAEKKLKLTPSRRLGNSPLTIKQKKKNPKEKEKSNDVTTFKYHK